MEKNNNKPKLRFLGFTKPWEQRKLSELVTLVVREVPKPTESYEKISVRSHAKGTFHQKIENPDDVAMDKLFVVRENDLIVNITFAWEHAIAVANKEDDGLLVSHRFPTYTMSNSDVGFIKYVVSQENFRRKMEMISPGGAGRNRVLDKKGFLDIKIIAPIEIEEQNKIGVIFTKLDYLINLHQRKLNHLQDKKKSLLQKMFPKNGKDFPELRFPGFTDPWEQRKLGNIVNIRSGRDYKHLSEGEIPVYGTGGYMLSVNKALSYKEDAIGIGRKGTINKPYILRAPFWTVDTLFYAVPENDNDLNFVYDIFQNINWKQKHESTGVPSLSKAVINNIDILIPDNKEQNQIGGFFQNIDNFITLHQRKLNHLKEQKKALLQQMFV
ncbi:restriction endonuclease subunit S [Clostridium scatologenes]|uniref:Type I restriction enzyme, specificity subunit n=1 Tax=Clostridium scatologenes TaxID=1548 RepID=A0A0E3M780_CLOSL|nr:restriction endonuclease subunit S [Clostridium scatologenes]AKA70472.1 Type I restriction enzyme, specificity subunit [Clostridium scatologenes]